MNPHAPKDPHAYCAWRTRSSGSSFYSSFFLLPKEKRRGMMALYAFCREIDDIVDDLIPTTTAKEEAHQQLSDWQASLHRLSKNEDLKSLAQEHPIAQALYDTTKKFNLSYSDLNLVIDGMRMDLQFSPYASWEQLFVYCDHVAGVVGRLSARIFGFQHEHEEAIMEYATSLGRALQLVNILRDGFEDRERGRIYIPQALWPEQFSWDDYQQHQTIDDSTWQAFYREEVIQAFLTRIDESFDTAIRALPKQEYTNQRAGIVMGRVYYQLYQHIKFDHQQHGEATRMKLSRSAFRLSTFTKWSIMLGTLLSKKNIDG